MHHSSKRPLTTAQDAPPSLSPNTPGTHYTSGHGKGSTSRHLMPTHKTERSNRAHLWTLHASWVQRKAPCSGPPPTAASVKRPASRQAQSPAGWSLGTASLLLQQRRDVDVPANGLPVKTAGEQVAHGGGPRSRLSRTIRGGPATRHSAVRAGPEQDAHPHNPVRRGL